jgi:diguanylate cyclase (GGDEF)-like protein
MPYKDAFGIASAAPLRPFKIIVPLAAVVICFSAICIYALNETRRTTWERAGDVAASLVSMIEADLVRNIGALNLSLQGVAEKLNQPDLLRISPEARQLALFDRAAAASHVGSIMVLDETGHLRFDSRTGTPKNEDLSNRDYFKAQRISNSKPLLYIGHPQASGNADNLFIGISRRLTNADGSFGGVVTGTLNLGYFKELFAKIALSADSHISLLLTDGTILMRWPYEQALIGRNIRGAEVFKRFAHASRGRFEKRAVVDGVKRLTVYSQVSDLPIIIGIGQSTDDIDAQWRRSAWIVGLLIAALCGLSGALGFVLLREFARRNAAERKLVTLATTDGLTGLSNRWSFDEAINREWRRAQHNVSMLALLMIDADRFKQYNDANGHQAGDQLLASLGSAVSNSIRGGIDVGARYGGDEFAVLLPETSLDGAERVADLIRARFMAAYGDDARISVGVACLTAHRSCEHAALLAAADTALYRAKSNGRDRTELARVEFQASQDAAIMRRPQAA